MNWIFIGIIFAVALLCCCMGFKRFVWFMSIGYGYAVAGIAVASLIYGGINGIITWPLALGNVVMAAYGIRLGTFLLKREMGNKAYRKILDAKVGKEPPIFVKIIAWLFMGALYVCETAGLHFRMTNAAKDDAVLIIGIVVMALGGILETAADRQKSMQKAKNPNMVAMEGLYRFIRCPNYFGEILFWTGVFVSGLPVYTGALQWIIALLGYIGIIYVMVDGAKRMEKGHIARYGANPTYRAYADKTPILLPLIPLYHLYNPDKDKKKG